MKCLCTVAFVLLAAHLALAQDIPIPANQAKQIEEAAPAKPRVKPKKAHRVLIWNTPDHLLGGDPHKGYCTPYGNHAMKVLGTKTGAYKPVAGNDVSLLLPENIRQFDAIILNNACGNWITPSDEAAEKLKAHGDKAAIEALLKKSFTEWLKNGGGVVAYHYALGANGNWREFHEMLGARLGGHPWNEEVGVKIEEPKHPLVAAFKGKGFRFADELFQFAKPYERKKVRVLLSIDNAATNMKPANYTLRADGDFPLAYVKKVGKGRVFYTVFGHRTEVYRNPAILQFYLDGIQFALGDLEAKAEPRPDEPRIVPSRAPSSQPDKPLPTSYTGPNGRSVRGPTAEEVRKITEAAPDLAPVKPAKPRKVLIYGKMYTHPPNPFAAKAIEILGRKTGAFETVVSDDPKMLLPRSIREFDAVLINNWHEREPMLPVNFNSLSPEAKAKAKEVSDQAKRTLLAFVNAGGGIAGVHAATAAGQTWPEYGKLIGGYYDSHIIAVTPIRNEQPDHPVNAALKGKDWEINDEIYLFRDPYSRKNLRVLLSIDLAKLKAAGKDPGHRPDGDYAISWVRPQGKGRVFYCSLGHNAATYWNPMFLRHMLAGIQYALGDLPAPDAPIAKE